MSASRRGRPEPPRAAQWLLRRVGEAGPSGLSVLGDLLEEYEGLRARRGRLLADLWFWLQTLPVATRLTLGRRRVARREPYNGAAPGGPGRPVPPAGRCSWSGEVVRTGRRLARDPVHAGLVVLVLALGIAAATTAFSLVNWVMLRPVPGVPSTERLATLRFMGRQGAQYSVPHRLWVELRERAGTFAELAAYTSVPAHLAADDATPRRLDAHLVTGTFFEVLRLRMAAGRGFTSAEGTDPDRARVVVLSERLAREIFGGAGAAIGETLRLSDSPFVVVGVAAPGFLGPTLPGTTDLWVPVAAVRWALPHYRPELLEDPRAATWRQMIGRLADGAGHEEAAAEMRALSRRVAGEFGEGAWFGDLDPVVTQGIGMAPVLRARMRRTSLLMMSAVGLLLVLTCADVAHLTLARATRRRREYAIRRALGATRERVVREVVGESLLLALAGGAAALALSFGLVRLFRSSRLATWLPELGDVSLDLRVLVFTLSVAVGSGLAAGIAPALRAARADAPGRGRGSTGRRTRRLLDGLVVTQLAVSLPLLVCAGLMARTVSNLRGVELGLEPRRVVSLSVEPSIQGYGPERTRELYREVVRRARELSGLEAVGIGYPAPFSGIRAGARLTVWGDDGNEAGIAAEHMQATAGFHEALSIPLVEGTGFDPGRITGDDTSRRTVVLGESLARALFADGPAVGRLVAVSVGGLPAETPHEVVGVVGDARLLALDDEPRRVVYQQVGDPWLPIQTAVVARARDDPAAAAAALRRVLADVAPALPVFDVGPLAGRIDRTIAGERLLARLGASVALLASMLAAAGVLGVVTTTVQSRTRELGIRLALGAAPQGLLGRIVARYVLMGAVGVGIGILGAAWLTRWLESVLFGVGRFDPLTLLAAAGAALGITVLSSLVPARRAARIDPVRTLAAE